MKVALLISVLLAGAAAQPALAQSSEVSPFAGPRVEGFGGFVRTLPDRKSVGPVTSTSQTPKHSGGTGGAEIGYDMPLGPVIVGAFGSFAEETGAGCGTLSGLNTTCLSPGRQIGAGARVGYVLADKFLIYGKGAYVNTRLDVNLPVGGVFEEQHRNLDGWRAGGGVEYALNRHVYLKAEYAYGRTDRFSAAPYGISNTTVSYHQHSGLGGVGFRF